MSDKFHNVALLILEEVERIDCHSVFAQPVSDDDVPDYSNSEGDFKLLYADFLLMFDNCRLYNVDGWIINEATKIMASSPKIYDDSCKNVVAKLSTSQSGGRGGGKGG